MINQYAEAEHLSNQFSGPIIIIGSGESCEQLERKDAHWRKFFSISCNFSQLHFPSPMFSCQDREFLMKARYSVDKHKTYNFLITKRNQPVIKSSLCEKLHGFHHPLATEENNNYSWIESKKMKDLRTKSPITGAFTIGAAHCMGFHPIIAVGFDAVPGRYNYHKNHYRMKNNNPRAAAVHAKKQFDFLKEMSKKIGLINCSTAPWAKKWNLEELISSKFFSPNKEEMKAKMNEIYTKRAELESNSAQIMKNWHTKKDIL